MKHKKSLIHSTLITVKRQTNRGRGGRGVFALENIKKGQTIETVPCIIIPRSESGLDSDDRSVVSWYVYEWTSRRGKAMVAVVLGYGSIYNHSYSANAIYEEASKDTMRYIAVKNIKKGKEIFINYNGKPNSKAKVKF